jgi:hypothetical protein
LFSLLQRFTDGSFRRTNLNFIVQAYPAAVRKPRRSRRRAETAEVVC